MELKFQEKKLPCLETLLRKAQTQEQTQELRVGDGMPDVGTVIGAWGQVILRGKEWNGDTLTVSGGTMVSVQYLPEQGGPPQTLESWIPFQQRWTLPEEQCDGQMLVQCSLKSVDARSTSARKLMLRATVTTLLQALRRQEKTCWEPGQVPEDVQLRTQSYPVQLPVEAGEKDFTMEETLPYPNGTPPAKLIGAFLQPEVTEHRLLADKLVFRGTGHLRVMWEGEDGGVGAWEFSLPFSQYSELDGEFGDDAQAAIWPVVTALEAEATPEGLQAKLSVVCQYVIRCRPMIRVVEDAYSPRRTVELRREPLRLPGILEHKEQLLQLHGSCPAEDAAFVNAALLPQQVNLRRQEEGITVEPSVRLQAMCRDNEGMPHNHTVKWDDSIPIPVEEHCALEAVLWPVGPVQGTMMAGNLQLQAQLRMDTDTLLDTDIPMVAALELGDIREPDPGRPSLVLCRAGERTLWQLAKENGALVQDIRDANALTGEPRCDQLLLIPIR